MPFERAVEYALSAPPPPRGPTARQGSMSAAATPAPPAPSPTGAADTPLTARELEVAQLLARGRTNRQIADELVIAERTASTHVTHILSKLGFSTRSQVAVWAVERGLHAPPHRLIRSGSPTVLSSNT